MSDFEGLINRVSDLIEERKIIPYPYDNTYLILLYTPKEVEDFLTYRSHDIYNEFRIKMDNPGVLNTLGELYHGRSKCIVLEDGLIILYVPDRIHTKAQQLISETTTVCTDALLNIAARTGTDISTSWVTLSYAIGHLQTIVHGFINGRDNTMAVVHPLVKRFDNSLYISQIEAAMRGMHPLECQQAMYRQNIERQNHVVTPKLQSWMSTTYYQ